METCTATEVANEPLDLPRHESLLVRKHQLRAEELQDQIRDLHSGFVCCLNQLLDLRDLNTGLHSTRLAEWGLLVARHLGVPEEDHDEFRTRLGSPRDAAHRGRRGHGLDLVVHGRKLLIVGDDEFAEIPNRKPFGS